METRPLVPAQPTAWILVFCRDIEGWWIRMLACGEFKHVRAYAYVPALRAWMFYDVTLSSTLLMTLPDGPEAEAYLGDFTRGADLVSMKPRAWKGWRFSPFSCVSAMKQLIGLRSGALRPDRLYRDCLAAGGTLLGSQHPASPGICCTAP